MSSGIKASANRPKAAKHLRKGTEKKFRNDSDEARSAYRMKITQRAARKLKKRK